MTQLPNGTRVVTEHIAGCRSVSTGFWVGVGGRDEAPDRAGVSHFLEHLLFKGTEDRSAREIAETVDAVGGEMNAFTTKEYTAYYTRLPDGAFELGLDLLADVFWSPAFRPAEVEAERQVILEEILMHEDTPEDRVHSILTEALFPDHPLGREVLGSPGTVEDMDRQTISAFHQEWYRPENVVVAAAGQVDHSEVVAAVGRCFTAPAGGAEPVRIGPAPGTQRLEVVHRATEQAHLAVGVRALSRRDPDRYALAVLNHVLGGGVSSRLFQKVREERGLAYSVYSYPAAYADEGALVVYAGTAPRHAHEVLALIEAELDHLVSHGVDDRELRVATGYLAGSTVLGLEDSADCMSRLGRSVLVHGHVVGVEELVDRYRTVTLDDVQRVVERVLVGADRSVAIVGPFRVGDFSHLG